MIPCKFPLLRPEPCSRGVQCPNLGEWSCGVHHVCLTEHPLWKRAESGGVGHEATSHCWSCFMGDLKVRQNYGHTKVRCT